MKIDILGLILLFLFISLILLIVFGQFTVRRLRKDPEAKEALGFEYISGRDIISVAQTLSWPAGIMRKLKHSKMGFFFADIDVLISHTTKVDRFLARIFYWSMAGSVLALLILMLMDSLGVFKK